MKKILLYTLFLLLGLSFLACSETDVELKKIVLDSNSISVTVGETETVEITDGNGGYSAEILEGEDNASVSVSGTTVSVTGIAAGDATILVKDKEGKSTGLTVVVIEGEKLLELESSAISVMEGETQTVNITEGNGTYTAEVTEGAEYASASVSGTVISVKGIAKGSATIAITDKKNKTASLAVTVTQELELESSTTSVQPDNVRYVAILSGNGGYEAEVTEGSDVVSVAIAEQDGDYTIKITPLKEGAAKITVTDAQGLSATLDVTVAPLSLAAAEQNLDRAIVIARAGLTAYYRGNLGNSQMHEYYTPSSGTGSGSGRDNGSCWSFAMGIEGVNSVIHAINEYKANGGVKDYDSDLTYFTTTLGTMYENIKFYRGTYPAPGLVSFTQTKQWSVYAVPRASSKNNANVTGVLNVYDDQEWLIREMIESYHLTGNAAYLTEAEYLTEYVLDGWDCTLDGNGNEYGGIPWGPGYNSMHACSNGPIVSPLVWLHDLYKDSDETIEYRYIGENGARLTQTVKKKDHYLDFAKKVYNYHKTKFMGAGVYKDMVGSHSGTIPYEVVGGVTYRAHAALNNASDGSPHSYNSGTMLSGAADLYRVTGDEQYMTDAKALATNAFVYFASPISNTGCYEFRNTSQFCRWFDCVLFRGYISLYPYYKNVDVCLAAYQNNLDHAYTYNFRNGFLPPILTEPWGSEKTVPDSRGSESVVVHATFAYATEYANLAVYEIEKQF